MAEKSVPGRWDTRAGSHQCPTGPNHVGRRGTLGKISQSYQRLTRDARRDKVPARNSLLCRVRPTTHPLGWVWWDAGQTSAMP